MPYSTLAEVVDDPGLGIPPELHDDGEAVHAHLAKVLMSMQAETVDGTSEQYRRTLEAWKFLSDSSDRSGGPPSTELLAISGAALERMFMTLAETQKQQTAATEKAAAANATAAAERRMLEHRTAAATRASSDFTKSRTLPLTGVAAAAATVWGTRSDFGADVSEIGTLAWTVGAVVVILLSGVFWQASHREQERMKLRVRQLYDPDVQSEALARLRLDWFSRFTFRESLGDLVAGGEYHGYAARLSTVDYDEALNDAGNLAIDRFVVMGVLETSFMRGAEMFRLAEGDNG